MNSGGGALASSGRLGLSITLGLGMVAAVVVTFLLVLSSDAEEVNLTSARLVPGDAGLFVGLNSDLDGSQWVNAFSLVERLGQDEPEAELKRTLLEDEDINWEGDIAPFLGGDAAFFLRSFDPATSEFSGGVVFSTNDPGAALEVLVRESDFTFVDGEHSGLAYQLSIEDGSAAGVLGDHLVVALDEDTMRDVIDVFLGESKSLADVDEFETLRDQLARNFLSFVYLNGQILLESSLDDETLQALKEVGIDSTLEPIAAVVGATGKGFTFQAASIANQEDASPLLAPRDSRYDEIVPAETAVFFSTFGIGGAYRDVIDSAGDDLDEAIRDAGYSSIDDLLNEAGAELGLNSLEDVLNLFEGETAVAVWFPTGAQEDAQGLLLTEVRDVVAAREVIEALVPESEPREVRDVNGIEVTIFAADDGDAAAYAFDGGDLLFGTADAVIRILEGGRSSLESSAVYRDTLGELPTGLGTFAYFDLGTLVRLSEGSLPPEISRAEEALHGLIINAVQEQGTTGVSGIVTVE